MSLSESPTAGRDTGRGVDGLFRRSAAWLFSQRHFHYKLLSGTAAGVVVIAFLAGAFLLVTIRNHRQESWRAHTIQVMRLSGVIENDIAALESGHRGYLLTGKQTFSDSFQQHRDLIKTRLDELAALILDTPIQRKRVIKVQEVIQKWVDSIATPEMNTRATDAPATADSLGRTSAIKLGNGLLDQGREILQSLQDEEQIVLNQRTREQEWAAQSTQILDFLPKLERAVIEMQKEKRGFLLTGESPYLEAYRRSVGDFYTYHGYLSILVASAPSQAQLLSEVRSSVERWINISANPELQAKLSGKDAGAMFGVGNGETVMREIQQTLEDFNRNELAVYEVRAAAASRERIIKTSVLGILAFLAITLLVASNSYSFVLVRRQLHNLESAEVRIRSIIENIQDGMITVDEEGVICSMNPAAEKMFGCVTNEMVGHKFTKLVPKTYGGEGDANVVPCAWEEVAARTGTTALAVGRTRKLTTFPIEMSLSEMVVSEKKLFVAMVRNVTERKRFEQEIAAEKESLAVTLRSIGDGVITTDVQGRIIMINHAGEVLTGCTSKEAIGQPLKSVFNVSIDLAAQARAQRSGYRNEAQSILLSLPESATLVARDGTERLIEQLASPIRDPKNEVAGVVLVFRDITERERNEGERRKAEALEQLGLLAGGIAHDFNNLLTAIIGNISLASLLLPANSEMISRLSDAKNASMRARDLAQQLLTFARGGAPIKKTASIGKLIQDTVSFSLRGSHSRSEFNICADLWPGEIDSGQISQVVANLAVNADQAMPSGGTLHVSCENFVYSGNSTESIPDLVPGEYIRISIRDEGVGIEEHYLKRIFDPYFTTKPKGNGLGLATTYSIIKNHNGLVTVESEMHVGTTFTIYLPAIAQEQAAVVETRRTASTPITGTGRVLVVDDEEVIRALVEFTLTHLGYEVCTSESALAGIQCYREHLEQGKRFDLVILDLTLPGGMGGKEALKKLIELDPTVNAIVSSGYAMDATMSRYQDFGFRGVIAKPYEASELGKIVHDTIEASHVQIAPDYEMRVAG